MAKLRLSCAMASDNHEFHEVSLVLHGSFAGAVNTFVPS